MSSFVYDGQNTLGMPPWPKQDQASIPLGAFTGSFVVAADWNILNASLVDIRTAITSGSYFGFGSRTTSGSLPSTVGGNNQDFLWMRNDGVLMLRKANVGAVGPTDFPVQLASSTSLANVTTLTEIDPNTLAGLIPSASLAIYARSNGLNQPNRRTQIVVRWWNDSTDTVIAEGNAF